MQDLELSKLPEPSDPAKTYQMWQSTQAEYDRLNPALEAMSKTDPQYAGLYQQCLWLSLAVLHFRSHYYWLKRQLYPPVYED